MATTRSTRPERRRSCVTMITVTPKSVSRASRKTSSRRIAMTVSTSPVGSSARSTFGDCSRAPMAMATRCCSPPESCTEPASRAVGQADQSGPSSAHGALFLRARDGGRPSSEARRSPGAVSHGTRLRALDCQTNRPSRAGRLTSSALPNFGDPGRRRGILPAEGRSSSAQLFSSVALPAAAVADDGHQSPRIPRPCDPGPAAPPPRGPRPCRS